MMKALNDTVKNAVSAAERYKAERYIVPNTTNPINLPVLPTLDNTMRLSF
ncbi:hypothetical protein M2408_005434 [Sphingobacterium sp. BIGb0165]|nr:hypothetical protein [Sphingobacterium sp. BIGb0165]